MAAQHFNADLLALSCAEGHQRFYRKMCGHETWSGLRNYPKVNAKVVCMGLHFPSGRERVELRYPSFRSTSCEREALFGALSSSLNAVLPAVAETPALGPLGSGKRLIAASA